jgi:hypothetical protein
MARITTTLSIAIAGENSVAVSSGVIEAEATSQIDVNLPDDNSEITVEIQPSASSQLHVLLLSSSYYGSELEYVFSDGNTKSSPRLTLDAPQMFSAGSMGANGAKPPLQILFKLNTMPGELAGEGASVSIFIARDATPPPPP